MPRYIDADAKVHAQVYDGQSETWRVEEVTIADALEAYSNEGCPASVDVEKVIRCKNCQFARCEFSAVRHSGGILLCARTGLSLLDGNGYCSWAELATDRPVEKDEILQLKM